MEHTEDNFMDNIHNKIINSSKNNMVFRRIEKKFLLNNEQYEAVIHRINNYITLDAYGNYTICNVYYDTKNNDLVSRSIEKPKYKEKLRVRSYGVPGINDKIFVEIKKKWENTVYKRRVKLRRLEWLNMLETKSLKEVSTENMTSTDKQILNEIEYFIRFYNPEPKMYIAYDRTAYYYKEDPNLRITFDANIRGRTTDIDLTKGDKGELLLRDGEILMEIKVPDAYPVWLAKVLSEEGIYNNSFSKYGNMYKKIDRIRRNDYVNKYIDGGIDDRECIDMYDSFAGAGVNNSTGVYVH